MYMTGYTCFEYALRGIFNIKIPILNTQGRAAAEKIIVEDAEATCKNAFADGWDLARLEFIINCQKPEMN